MRIVGGLASLLLVYALTQASLPTMLLWLSLAAAFAAGWWGLRWFWPAWVGWVLVNFAMGLAYPPVPYGFLGNPNVFGIACAVGLAVVLSYRYWLVAPLLLVGVGYSASRTAFFGAGVALFLSLFRRFPATAICLFLLSALGAVLISDGRGGSFVARLGIWQDTLNHLTLWGSGLGTFADAYASWPQRTAPAMVFASHAYNDALELIFELGVFSIPLFIYLILVLEAPAPEPRIIALTFLACSLTFFPLHVPSLGIAFTFALGQLTGAYNGQMVTSRSTLPQRRRHGVGIHRA